jgi:hypothetical protein
MHIQNNKIAATTENLCPLLCLMYEIGQHSYSCKAACNVRHIITRKCMTLNAQKK